MRVVVTGSTGLIGIRLCAWLIEGGHEVVSLSRDPDSAREKTRAHEYFSWDALHAAPPAEAFEGADSVIHLAGTPIAEGRWSKKRKALIRDSRVIGTRFLVKTLASLENKPGVLISGSAIGFYGTRHEDTVDESSSAGKGYLPEVCQAWESESLQAEKLGIRTVLVRTGIVLSPDGGALAKMLPPFRLGLGGPVGNGRQWMSWIHLEDEVRLIDYALSNDSVSGILNGTAPYPVRNAEFTRVLGQVLKRPAFMPLPGVVLKMAFGEMAQSLLLEGQKVLPKATESSGFEFRFPQLDGALRDLLGKQ